MNQHLTTWLETARANLAPRAKEIVRDQIVEHFATATERYQHEKKSVLEAETLALADLGDAGQAAKKFEKAYLTTRELKGLILAKERNKSLIPILAILVVMFSAWYRVFFVRYNDPSGLHFLSPWLSTSLLVWMLALKIGAKRLTLRNFVVFEMVLNGLFVCLMTFLLYPEKDYFFGSNGFLIAPIPIFYVIHTFFTRFLSWRKLSSL